MKGLGEVPETIAAELRELWALARTTRGTLALDAPARLASVKLTERLAELVEQGYTPTALDRAMGAGVSMTRNRLARHGYRKASPSIARKAYRGVVHRPVSNGSGGRPRVDVTGQTYNRLTGVRWTGESSRKYGALWVWSCACGGELVAPAPQVRAGKVRNCAACGPKRNRGTYR